MRFPILKVKTEKRRIGDIGERAAARFLKRAGYKILKRNFVCEDGEIDIICADKTTVAFVEVKTRTIGKESPMEPRPASAVTPEKQRKIIKIAALYGAFFGKGKRKRLDIIEVFIDDSAKVPRVKEIKHLPAAFDRGDAYTRRY